MNRATYLLRFTASVAGLTVLASIVWLVVWVTIIPLARGWQPVVITSGSMEPAISPGDVVVAQRPGGAPLAPGSVIVFDNPAGDGLVTHRIVALDADGRYVTQGDANTRVDSTPVPAAAVHGYGRVLVPEIGTPYVWLADGRWPHLIGLTVALIAAGRMAAWPFTAPASRPRSARTGAEEAGRPGRRRRPAPHSIGHVGAMGLVIVVSLLAAGTTTWSDSDAAFSDPTSTDVGSFSVAEWKAILEIDGGVSHTCLTRAEGFVWCWGLNNKGQLGDGTTNDSLVPVDVGGVGGVGRLSEVVDLATGNLFSCAVTSGGAVRCWGENGHGQLGDNSEDQSLTPVVVVGPGGSGTLSGIAEVTAGGEFACGRNDAGSVWCWGRNEKGQLGDNSEDDSSVPVQVVGPGGSGFLTDVVRLSAGLEFVCAVKVDGSVWCWGKNGDGQLGDNSKDDSSVPVRVVGPGGSGFLSGAVEVAAGESFACAVIGLGAVRCWGRNERGQLGDGSTDDSLMPVAVGGSGSSGVVDVAAGLEFVCAAKDDGSAWCWGDNGDGQLGDNSEDDSSVPVQVVGDGGTGTLSGATLVGAGSTFSCAALSDWTARCWGRNDKGQLGNNTTSDSTSPVLVKGAGWSGVFDGALALTGGLGQTCALKVDGTVWCWGRNDRGQLGDGTTDDSLVPVSVRGPGGTGVLSDVVGLSAGLKFVCAVKVDGSVWCWGDNEKGQLGDGSTTNSSTPVQVVGVGGVGTLSGVVEFSAGEAFACVVNNVGMVWCWGRNEKGQLGDGTTDDSTTPVPVSGIGGIGTLINVVDASAGQQHACAVDGSGTTSCWGANGDGQLGDNSEDDSSVPVQVVGVGGSGTLTGVASVDLGTTHSCALRTDSTVRCWGRNDKGQLGNNTTTDSTSPVQVKGQGGVGALGSIDELGVAGFRSCGLTGGGGVWCWGRNDKGQLGDNTTTDRSTPVPVVDETGSGSMVDAAAIGAGTTHGCAVRTDTYVWCWGLNSDGQLGDGTKDNSSRPVQVL